jgi:hypothetical protein
VIRNLGKKLEPIFLSSLFVYESKLKQIPISFLGWMMMILVVGDTCKSWISDFTQSYAL